MDLKLPPPLKSVVEQLPCKT